MAASQTSTPKYMFCVDGNIYIGRYKGTVESACGLMLRLEFKDGTTWAESANDCVTVSPGHPLSPTGPPNSKMFNARFLEAVRKPHRPPRGSYPQS
ncbi:hypothetical protein BV20DRAFT_960749 [Pilatotrama ljubarskyi]|nr:hypothetical protein BV20DRAFT_960749 [Pilatotrama ljubarskyi]